MKKSVILILLAGVVIVGAIVYLNKSKTPPPAPQPVAQSAPPATEGAPAEPMAPAKADAQSAVPVKVAQPAPAVATTPPATDTNATAPTNTISKTIDALLAAKRGKHEMFQELMKNGQIDAAIAELQQRKAANPNDPEIATTLGEALLNKVRGMHDSGNADLNEMGILAMTADQNFNAALKQDPNNWEAQFVKYTSMSYWPADATRDADIVQHLSSLIDQTGNMPSQPEFVQPYIALIRQYRKMGRDDEAAATWKLAQQRFPGDPQLQQLANGQ